MSKATVRHIRFYGNQALKAGRLRKEMKTKQSNPLGFITGAGRLSSVQLDDDVQKLKALYQDNGYADVQISDVKIERVNPKKVDIFIYITEGAQYHVNAVTIQGIQIVTEANFRKVIKETEGQVFSPSKLEKDIKAVEDAYGIAGYADAKVSVQTTPAGPALVDLHYKIEEGIRGKSAEERRAVRQQQSTPHCEALKRFLEKQLGRVSAKAPIAQAIRYALKHWEGLTRFLNDGRIDLDSNIVERSMRPQALTRKNALFAGHDDGAQNWAIVASLIETCKLNGIDPYTYLADVLSRLVNLWPNARLDELLPWPWAAARDHLQRAA